MRSRDGQVDNKAADPPANTEPQNAPVDTTLPPRVVVELPDGEVQIGEDSQRLQHEQVQVAGTANRNGSTHRAGAQPGTEQWLELRRLLYATALEAISIKRKRISSLLVAIDLLYMLMTIAAAFISTSSRDSMSDWLPPSKQNIRLIVAVMGALLDMVTLAFVMREQRKSTRLMAIFHLFLLLPAMIHEYVPLAIIRMLVATFLARFLACLVELDWVVSGQPLSNKPSPAWLQGGLLGMHLAGLRQDYMNAMARMDRVRAAQMESAAAGDDSMESGVVWSMQLAAVRPVREVEPAVVETPSAASASDRSQYQSAELQGEVEEVPSGTPSNTRSQAAVETSSGIEGVPDGGTASHEADNDTESHVVTEQVSHVESVSLSFPPAIQ